MNFPKWQFSRKIGIVVEYFRAFLEYSIQKIWIMHEKQLIEAEKRVERCTFYGARSLCIRLKCHIYCLLFSALRICTVAYGLSAERIDGAAKRSGTKRRSKIVEQAELSEEADWSKKAERSDKKFREERGAERKRSGVSHRVAMRRG